MDYLVVFFCFAITLHNIEEAIWLPKWSQQSSKFQKSVTPSEFHFAVIVITALAYLSAFSFLYLPESDFAKWIFIGFLVICGLFGYMGAAIAGEVGLVGGIILGALLMIFVQLKDIYEVLVESTEEKK